MLWCFQEGHGAHAHGGFVPGAGVWCQLGQGLEDAQVEGVIVLGGVANVADEADEGWVAGVDGDGDGFDAVGGDEEVGGAPVGPVAGQAQGGGGEGLPAEEGALEDVGRHGQGEIAGALPEVGGGQEA